MGSPTRLACLILLFWMCSDAQASDAFTGEITPLVDIGNNVYVSREVTTAIHVGGIARVDPFGFHAGASGAWGPSRPSPRGMKVDAVRELLQRGATLRLAHRSEEEVAPIFDLTLYGRDPDLPRRLQAPKEVERPAWYVSLEGTRLFLELDPSNQAGTTTQQTGDAVALEARGQLSGVRVQALAWMRDIDFIQAEVPGYPVFQALPLHVDQQPERAFRVAADYRIRSISLSPGLVTTVTWPAVLEMEGLVGGNDPLGGASPRGVFFYDPNVVSFYWGELDLAPTWEVKVISRWDPHPSLTVLGEVGRYANPNRRLPPQTTPPLVAVERPEDAIWFGSVLAQARF